MAPAFFESLLDLIVKTSTDLPPGRAGRDALRNRRRTRLDPFVPGAQHHRAEHRPGRQRRRRHLPGHRHADLRDQDAGRHQPDRAQEGGPPGRCRGHKTRQAAAQLRRLDHGRQLGRQPRAGHAHPPLRAVGERRRDRGAADPEGRRLREHERAVLRCRPSSRILAAPTARSRASASASSTPSGRRRARGARPARSVWRSAATARRAISKPNSSCSARSTT